MLKLVRARGARRSCPLLKGEHESRLVPTQSHKKTHQRLAGTPTILGSLNPYQWFLLLSRFMVNYA